MNMHMHLINAFDKNINVFSLNYNQLGKSLYDYCYYIVIQQKNNIFQFSCKVYIVHKCIKYKLNFFFLHLIDKNKFDMKWEIHHTVYSFTLQRYCAFMYVHIPIVTFFIKQYQYFVNSLRYIVRKYFFYIHKSFPEWLMNRYTVVHLKNFQHFIWSQSPASPSSRSFPPKSKKQREDIKQERLTASASVCLLLSARPLTRTIRLMKSARQWKTGGAYALKFGDTTRLCARDAYLCARARWK